MDCKSYCEHGGVCELESGHEGQHDSRYCQWDDANALDKAEADRRYFEKADAQGVGAYARFTETLRDTIGEEVPNE